MFTARHKTALHRNAIGCSDDLHLHPIEVLVLAGTESAEGFSLEEFAPADADIVARCQRKAIQDVHPTAVELFENSSQLLEQTVKQLCQPVQPLGKATFQGKVGCHAMSAHVVQ